MSFRSARIRAGLKVAEVQKAMQVSDAAVYMWETHATRPRAALLPKLAALYRCTIDELLSEDEAVSGAEIPLQESRKSENVLRLENA